MSNIDDLTQIINDVDNFKQKLDSPKQIQYPPKNNELFDLFYPEILMFLAKTFRIDNLKIQKKSICDIIVNDKKIGVRIRRKQYLPDYHDQFTFSIKTDRSGKSELIYILDEHQIDYMFHCFENINSTMENPKISHWTILNMHSLTYEKVMSIRPDVKVNRKTQDTFIGVPFKKIINPDLIISGDPILLQTIF